MSENWRDKRWDKPSVKCNLCGLEGLVPIPRSALGVPFWAIPEHDSPYGHGFCPKSLTYAPEQFLEDGGFDSSIGNSLPRNPEDLLTNDEHATLNEGLAEIAATRRRVGDGSDQRMP